MCLEVLLWASRNKCSDGSNLPFPHLDFSQGPCTHALPHYIPCSCCLLLGISIQHKSRAGNSMFPTAFQPGQQPQTFLWRYAMKFALAGSIWFAVCMLMTCKAVWFFFQKAVVSCHWGDLVSSSVVAFLGYFQYSFDGFFQMCNQS